MIAKVGLALLASPVKGTGGGVLMTLALGERLGTGKPLALGTNVGGTETVADAWGCPSGASLTGGVTLVVVEEGAGTGIMGTVIVPAGGDEEVNGTAGGVKGIDGREEVRGMAGGVKTGGDEEMVSVIAGGVDTLVTGQVVVVMNIVLLKKVREIRSRKQFMRSLDGVDRKHVVKVTGDGVTLVTVFVVCGTEDVTEEVTEDVTEEVTEELEEPYVTVKVDV
ncbi:MAG: hypothetical protein Q9194_003217 [Teloschistes cf. exilis]